MLLVVVESLPETGRHEAAVEGRQPGLGGADQGLEGCPRERGWLSQELQRLLRPLRGGRAGPWGVEPGSLRGLRSRGARSVLGVARGLRARAWRCSRGAGGRCGGRSAGCLERRLAPSGTTATAAAWLRARAARGDGTPDRTLALGLCLGAAALRARDALASAGPALETAGPVGSAARAARACPIRHGAMGQPVSLPGGC